MTLGIDTKICTKCKIEKEYKEFYKANHHTDYLTSNCKKCTIIRQVKYMQSDQGKKIVRKKYLNFRYKISEEYYNKLKQLQNNQCAICLTEPTGLNWKKEPNILHVDHDHKTKQIRSLLCGNCNRGLGIFKESKELLLSASNYLDKFKKE